MKNPVLAFLAVAALVASAPAFAQEVSYDYDKTFDFSKAKTYGWIDGTPLKDQFNHQRIVSAVDAQLKLKGLTLVVAGATADVLVAYHASFDKDVRISGFSSGFGGYRFGATRSGTATVDDILVGTIIVDVVSAAEKKIVWRGMATKEVDPKADPEKREKNINKAAEKLFKNFPPPVKK